MNINLPSIGTRIIWTANPKKVWIVDHRLPLLNQFEAHLEGNPLEGTRFDLDQLKDAKIIFHYFEDQLGNFATYII